MKKLPDAEFEIMKTVWELEPPVTSGMIIEFLCDKTGKKYKPQTIHTLLGRLVERGFLESVKTGKERFFTPLIRQEDYLQFEAQNFVKQYYNGSRLNLINTLYQGKDLSEEDIAQLTNWINTRRD